MPTFHSDDVPEALRDTTSARSPSSSQTPFPLIWVAMIGVGAIALGAITALLWPPVMTALNRQGFFVQEEADQRIAAPSSESALTSSSNISDDPQSPALAEGAGVGEPVVDELLGHRAYEEAPEEDLVPVVGDASILLRAVAADHFADMVQAARGDGIRLQPLSGFRTEEDQAYLFFEVKKDRRQSSLERATVSAPPGYSEHHTGYAIDIGDPARPGTNLDESFAETEVFEWLQDNALAYGFELSFQGEGEETVSYEPWHWRFVGDRHSLETFYGEGNLLQGLPVGDDPSVSDSLSVDDAPVEDRASDDEKPSF